MFMQHFRSPTITHVLVSLSTCIGLFSLTLKVGMMSFKCDGPEWKSSTPEEKKAKLNTLYHQMTQTILRYQSPTTGLFPLETREECIIGDVRTSIYCALSVWSLHLGYRKILSDDGGRSHLLSQTAVKTMRGILSCWMYQIQKLKMFTTDQVSDNALHLRFNKVTGQALSGYEVYSHLQLDCISLYLLSLVQMIASGLHIIYTCDEVDFVQNLVFCIERSYRIADYGMWERGSKYNNGTPELNASSVGMAKAAMEAVNGFNLFGEHGTSWTVIYVDIDAHMRNRVVFESLIPRESSSKSTDAALLPALSWPCFAIHDNACKETAINTIISELQGHYGLRRFHRDGYGTVLENKRKQFYDPSEIKIYDGVECEWPFLIFFLVIDYIFVGNYAKASEYYSAIEPCMKYSKHGLIVPKYYYVPKDGIADERKEPGSIERLASIEGSVDDNYFLWGQSVFFVMNILMEKLVAVNDLDPIKRYLSASERPRFSHRYMSFEASQKDRLIQVCVIAESVRLQQTLATHGILSQTPTQVEPIQIWSPNQLMKALKYMGVNYKLGLEGRPNRPVGHIGTSMFYRICGQTVISYPLLFEVNDFYTSQDLRSVVDEVQYDMMVLSNTWKLSGRPTYLIMITEAMVQSANAKDLIELLATFKSGVTSNGVAVKLDRLQSMVSSGTKEHLDFLTHFNELLMQEEGCLTFDRIEEKVPDQSTQIKVNLSSDACPYKKKTSYKDLNSYPEWRLQELFRATDDVQIQSNVLKVLYERHSRNYLVDGVTINDLLEKIRIRATLSSCPDWETVRLCSALTHKIVDSLAPSITNMLIKGKIVTLGLYGGEETVICKPINPASIGTILYDLCLKDQPCEAVLQQELILMLGRLHSTQPVLFDGILKIRIGWIIHAMQVALDEESPNTTIFCLAPSEVNDLLYKILQKTKEPEYKGSEMSRRQMLGSLGSVPKRFYEKIWYILERTQHSIVLEGFKLPLQPTLSDLTVHEMRFTLLVEEMLSAALNPLHRQICVEILTVASIVLERNPEVAFANEINVSQILHEVLSLFKRSKLNQSYSEEQVIEEFYKMPTYGQSGTFSYIAKAICLLFLDNSIDADNKNHDCCIM